MKKIRPNSSQNPPYLPLLSNHTIFRRIFPALLRAYFGWSLSAMLKCRLTRKTFRAILTANYKHIHFYDKDGNPLDIDRNAVSKKDPAAHIKFED